MDTALPIHFTTATCMEKISLRGTHESRSRSANPLENDCDCDELRGRENRASERAEDGRGRRCSGMAATVLNGEPLCSGALQRRRRMALRSAVREGEASEEKRETDDEVREQGRTWTGKQQLLGLHRLNPPNVSCQRKCVHVPCACTCACVCVKPETAVPGKKSTLSRDLHQLKLSIPQSSSKSKVDARP